LETEANIKLIEVILNEVKIQIKDYYEDDKSRDF